MDENKQTVLFVDDDEAVGQTLVARLEQWKPGPESNDQKQFEAIHVPSGEKALEFLTEAFADVVLADFQMPGMDGMELLQHIQRDHPGTPVVMLTAHATISRAVEAMKLGAADFVEKPWDYEELVASLKRAINSAPAERRDTRAHTPETRAVLEQLPTMERAMNEVRRAAQGTATVLIRGESGTGKNVTAHMLHDLSPRAKGPFITVQCSGIPDQLLESELFGHEPHSFTDAGPKRKEGRVAWAQGGTLFLDEIGDVPLQLQVKLLRLVEKPHLYTRLGGDKDLVADVRLVAATHRDLEKMVEESKFRLDLFWRLRVIPIFLPPLRERREEIEQLALQFLDRFTAESGRARLRLGRDGLEALRSFHWPGNIRQLENTMEWLAVMAGGDTLTADHVRQALGSYSEQLPHLENSDAPLDQQMKAAEKAIMMRALAKTRGNKMKAARLLGIARRSLYYKLKAHGLERWRPPEA
jgi:DNA-binding NtrC family response regulator